MKYAIRTREHLRHVYNIICFAQVAEVVTSRIAFPAVTRRHDARLGADNYTMRRVVPPRSICQSKCLFYRISIGYTDAPHRLRRRWRHIKAAEISASA